MTPVHNVQPARRPFAGDMGPDAITAIIALVAIGLLAYIPFSEALNYLLQVQIFGYGALVTVLPTAVAFACLGLLALKRPQALIMPLAGGGLAVIVSVARMWAGLAGDGSLLHQLALVRYLILLPCYISLGIVACKSRWFRLSAPRVIVAAGLVHAVAGILYSLGLFSFRVVGVDENVRAIEAMGGMTRASGLFTGTNVYAAFLALGVLVCVSTRWKTVTRVACCGVLFGGIITSQSRYPLAAAAIAVVWCTWREGVPAWGRVVRFTAIAVAVFLAPVMLQNSSQSVADRLSDDSIATDYGTRLDKAIVGLRATFRGLDTILLGARPEDLEVGNDSAEIFSDNSYVELMVSVGLPLAVLFLAAVGIFFQTMRRRNARPVGPFWFVVLSAALFNNAILWDSWIYTMVMIYGLLGYAEASTSTSFAARASRRMRSPRAVVFPEAIAFRELVRRPTQGDPASKLPAG